MAALVLSDILARIRTVLEAAPVSLVETREAFSHERQPNATLDPQPCSDSTDQQCTGWPLD